MDTTTLILVLMISLAAVDGYKYMAIVPNNIRPNSELVIPIKFNQPVYNEVINVKLFKSNYDAPPIVDETKMVNGVSEVTMILQIPPTISWGNYPLNITGTGTINFKNSTTMYGSTKALSIFIQTDKGVYKPGDTVKYRVFAVNGSLSPITTDVDVEIFDPKDNKIAEQMGVSSAGSTGISGELPLSDMPPLGSWKIKVTAPSFGEYASETFRYDVKEYVLPKFEVSVELPSYGLTTMPTLPVKVKAKYVFGKPVKGNLVLDVSRRYGSNFYDVASARTETMISGEATVNVPAEILERLTRNFDYESFTVLANVTETLTGITQTGSESVQYHKQPYQLEFYPNLPDNYKPMDSFYEVVLKVTTRDGKPPIDVTEHVKVDISFFLDKKVSVVVPDNLTFAGYDLISPFYPGDTVLIKTMKFPVTSDGSVSFNVTIPKDTATASIKAQFMGETRVKQISRFRSPGQVYVKAEMTNTGPLKIGDMANVKVTNNKGAATAFYFIKSKGLIVDTGSIQINANKEGTVDVKLTRDMTPSARLVVYYIDSTGEIVADGINFIVEDIFENKVTVEFDQQASVEPKTSVNLKVKADVGSVVNVLAVDKSVTVEFDQQASVEPKTSVNLMVKADVGSVVNVLAVDKSVRLMKEGNDITQDRVSEQLRQYGDSPWFSRTSGWGRVLPWSFPGDDAAAIFNNARVKVLTDALLHEFNLWSLRQPRIASKSFATMDMESAPMAMGSAGGMVAPQGQIRQEFPETWIMKTAIADQTGMANFPDMAPDTMTTFVASAYALNDNSGLGVSPDTADLLVSVPLFVILQLPYSIVRNEVAVIQANIFTSYTEDVNVTVTLEGSDQFKSVTIVTVSGSYQENEVTGNQTKCVLPALPVQQTKCFTIPGTMPNKYIIPIMPSKSDLSTLKPLEKSTYLECVQRVQVKAGTPTPVFYNIKPTKLGDLVVNVTATASTKNRFDKISKMIPVKAEGEEKEANIPELVTFKTMSSSVTTYTWPVEASASVVPGSESTRFTVIGDVFGPSFKNLDKLIRLPYGCGEQNMINFAPSVYTAIYMNQTGRFEQDTALQSKILNALRTGYQRQLQYQRMDGSFSAFGEKDDEGSLWLTAFVVKSFAQANKLKLIYIDPKVVNRAVTFILRKQSLIDGTFRSSGTLHNKAMQGSTADNIVSLTAYISITLYEAKESGLLDDLTKMLLTDQLQKANNFLKTSVPNMNTDYEAAIAGLALKLAKYTEASKLLNKLETSQNIQRPDQNKYWKNVKSHSLELEIASYALMIYAQNGATGLEEMKVLKWLIGNRGPFGGYASTQDTVVAIQATSEFAALIYTRDINLNIKVTLDGAASPTFIFNVDSQNQDVLQYKDAGKFNTMKIEASGKGTVMIDANIFYNVFSEAGQDSYIMNVKTTAPDKNNYVANIFYNVFSEAGQDSYIVNVKTTAPDKNSYVVTACARYNISGSQSNMAMMDIGILSGFEAVMDQIQKTPLIKRIENNAGRVVIYFHEIPSTEVCVDVPAQRIALVSGVKSVPVLAYSYYEPVERKMVSYLPDIFQTGNICDICGTECGCGGTPTPMGICGA